MRVAFQALTIKHPQKEIPEWSRKVERWYQLDAHAFGLCQALSNHPTKEFDWMVLASPEASTETDFHFAQSETSSPQKFVHTLPNVRASMALQAVGQKSELICMLNAPYTINDGIEEFMALSKEQKQPLFASCINLDSDYSPGSPKTYGIITLSLSDQGDWKLEKTGSNKVEDELLIKEIFDAKNTMDFGQWTLEKISE